MLRHLVRGEARAKPLHEVPVVLSLDVNQVDIVLEEMAVIRFWDLNIVSVLVQVDLDSVVSKLLQEI